MDDPQSLNLYNYMRNNPLSGVDADGHSPNIMVIEEAPNWETNPFGHTAIAITGKGVFSSGTAGMYGTSVAGFLNSQAKDVNITVTIIPTTSNQDDAAATVLQNYESKTMDYWAGDDCSTRSNNALNAAGIPQVPPIVMPDGLTIEPNPFWPGSAGARAELSPGSQTTQIPQGSTVSPSTYQEFDKKPAPAPAPAPKPAPSAN
jgi:hypothetical protein